MALTKVSHSMITGAVVNVLDFGAVGDGVADDTQAIQDAIDSLPTGGGTVFIPGGLYLIDPAVSLIVQTGDCIVGEGQEASQFIAKPVGGTIIKRQRNIGSANAYVTAVAVRDIAIILRHPATANPSNYYQIAIDYHSITRSFIERVYIGNYQTGASSALTQPASQADARQGYGVVIATTSSGDPAYAGGEVNTLRNVMIAGVRYGITIDDPTFFNPGYSSAAYTTLVDRCEVQIAEVGIAQWNQFGAGCTFANNTIQSIDNMRGSSATTYGLYLGGYEHLVYGGYNESPNVDYELFLTSGSRRNRILPWLSDNGVFQDNGIGNVYERIDGTTNKWDLSVNKQNYARAFARAWVTFYWDGSAVVIQDSYNISGVVRIGVGDYRIDFAAGVMPDANYTSALQGSVSASGQRALMNLRTPAAQTATNYRILTYNQTEIGRAHV